MSVITEGVVTVGVVTEGVVTVGVISGDAVIPPVPEGSFAWVGSFIWS